MKHLRLYVFAVIGVLVALVFLTACGDSHTHESNNNINVTQPAATPTTEAWRTQIDLGQNNIGLEITLVSDSDMVKRGHPADHLGFVVGMTTHAGNLMIYDMVASSQLENGLGRAAKPLGWDSLSDDSHHRAGLLYFAKDDAAGEALISPDAKYLELTIREMGAPMRQLRWQLPFPG